MGREEGPGPGSGRSYPLPRAPVLCPSTPLWQIVILAQPQGLGRGCWPQQLGQARAQEGVRGLAFLAPGFPACFSPPCSPMQAPTPSQCPPAGTSGNNTQRPRLCPQTRVFIVSSCQRGPAGLGSRSQPGPSQQQAVSKGGSHLTLCGGLGGPQASRWTTEGSSLQVSPRCPNSKTSSVSSDCHGVQRALCSDPTSTHP